MKRLIVICFSLLFLTTCVSSSAIGFNRKIKNDTIQDSEIKSIDLNREVITYISCIGDPLKVKFEGEFYFEMWEDEGIPLIGLKFKFFPPRIGPYIRTCTHVIAPFFILLHYNVHYGSCFVIGIAIGNIEWE